MNVKKLKVGMEIKNYKELCELLEIDVRNGTDSKKKQLEEFKKCFEYEKIGRSFKITKIYSKPRAFSENEIIELLLLHMLANNDNEDKYTIVSTKRNMYEKLKMVNSNYKYCLNNPAKVATYKNIPEQVVIDTTSSIDRALKNKLEKALENLYKRKTLFYSDIHIICYSNNTSDHRVATKDEVKLCLGIEGDILKELKCELYRDVILQKKEVIYKKRVSEEFLKHGINSFYRGIEINFIERRVPDLVKKFIRKYKLSKKNYSKYINKVNKQIQLQTKDNAKKRLESASSEIIKVTSEIRDIKKNNEKLEKIESELRHDGFNFSSSSDRRVQLEIIEKERVNDYDIDKIENRLEILTLRLDDNYLLYVDELIKLVIDMNTVDFIDDMN